jgi:hypothetical protein
MTLWATLTIHQRIDAVRCDPANMLCPQLGQPCNGSKADCADSIQTAIAVSSAPQRQG